MKNNNLVVKSKIRDLVKKGSSLILSAAFLIGPSSSLATNVSTDNQNTSIIATNDIRKDMVKSKTKDVTIEITTGVNLFIDDEPFLSPIVNGKIQEPFIYNGITYAPVRSISEAFYTYVGWDQDYQSVLLGSPFHDIDDATFRQNNAKPSSVKENKIVNATAGINIYFYSGNSKYNKLEIGQKGSDFKPAEVYIIDDTTYLPLKTITEINEIDLAWEQSNNGVYIGKHKKLDNITVSKELYYPNLTEKQNENMALGKKYLELLEPTYSCFTYDRKYFTELTTNINYYLGELYRLKQTKPSAKIDECFNRVNVIWKEQSDLFKPLNGMILQDDYPRTVATYKSIDKYVTKEQFAQDEGLLSYYLGRLQKTYDSHDYYHELASTDYSIKILEEVISLYEEAVGYYNIGAYNGTQKILTLN